MRPDLKIFGLTGLPSSGKGLFSETAKDFGFSVIVMGDVIRNECKNRGLPINRESSDKIMLLLRAEKGENAIAIVVVEWIIEAIKEGKTKIIVDGIRSIAEVQTFKEHFPDFMIIAVHADPNTRLKRAMTRKRVDDAFSDKAFHKRDQLELDLGICDVIAKSDILISSVQSIDKTKEIYASVIHELMESTGSESNHGKQ